MVKICEIKRALTAMREAKNFNDDVFFDFVRDPRYIGHAPAIEVKFKEGDVTITLEAPVYTEDEYET